MTASAQPGPPHAAGAAFRPDIEGLRAVAVLSVLIYHAGLAWTPGGYVGVDVFFVISGFLITSLMVREIERHGRLRLADFWARRARRLLPASTLVLAFSALVALLWLPVNTRKDFGGDIVASALYVVNWRLGAREVDYLAEQVGQSPVQHFWSLAVEEQFYVVWPLLIAALIALSRQRWRGALLVGIAIVSLASFVFALSYAVSQPGLAFFVSTTRVWELGVGALLAISFPTLVRLPPVLRGVLGWAGLGAVAASVLILDASTVWPGPATLLPVLGTAAAILAGGGAMPVSWGVGRLLGLRPAVWIGGLSYSLYLWHWPFLIAADGLWDDLRVRHSLMVVLASAVPAWLSYRYVENPLRRSRRLARPRTALTFGAGGMVTATAAGAALIASFSFVDTVDVATAAEAPGARALADPMLSDTDWTAIESVEAMRPSPLNAYTDLPDAHGGGCVVPRDVDGFEVCEFGDTQARRTVVLVGDSKAVQWFTPVETIAEREGWRLVLISKNGCPFADAIRLVDEHRNPSCDSWSPQALRAIEEMKPDVVITTTRHAASLPPGGRTSADYESEAMIEGLVTYWERVLATGARLVPILDTPGPSSGTVPDCVQKNLDDLPRCGKRLEDGLRTSGAHSQLAAAQRVPGVRVVDMSPVLCPDGVHCPAVVGNVLVYRGGTHITDTFAASATEELAQRLARATDGLLGAR